MGLVFSFFFVVTHSLFIGPSCFTHDEIHARIRQRGVLAYVQREKNCITEPTVALNAIILHHQSSNILAFLSPHPYLCRILIPCSYLHSLLAQPWVPLPLTSWPRVLLPSHCIPWSELSEQWVTTMPEISPLKLLFFLWFKSRAQVSIQKMIHCCLLDFAVLWDLTGPWLVVGILCSRSLVFPVIP